LVARASFKIMENYGRERGRRGFPYAPSAFEVMTHCHRS
jgi:hypothetical protein